MTGVPVPLMPSTFTVGAGVSESLPPIQSRFLFVDVAALRAKQLRKGARVRFEREPGLPAPSKAERVAMEEVRRGLVKYEDSARDGVIDQVEAE